MIDLDLQFAASAYTPTEEQFEHWVAAALKGRRDETELTIRVVDREESRGLNDQYRGKDQPTNVLSFPFETLDYMELPLIGDVVICAAIVEEEAKQQGKEIDAHWAHMVIHGILHLLGYDHIEEEDAQVMETTEIKILAELGYSNPYQIQQQA